MKDQIYLTTNISSKFKFVIGIHNVPLELLEKKDDTYTLLYEDKQNTCLFTLKGNHYNFIEKINLNEKTKKSLQQNPFIYKNDNGTIDLHLHIHIDNIPKINDKKHQVLIEVSSNKSFSLRLEIHNKTQIVMKEIQNAKIKYDKKQQIKNDARSQQRAREDEKWRKKEEILKLVEKFDELEARNKSYVNEDKILINKGIYLVDPRSFKRCENCANYTGTSVCSAHNVEVSENNRCSRFYSYKTVYGGSFSPK